MMLPSVIICVGLVIKLLWRGGYIWIPLTSLRITRGDLVLFCWLYCNLFMFIFFVFIFCNISISSFSWDSLIVILYIQWYTINWTALDKHSFLFLPVGSRSFLYIGKTFYQPNYLSIPSISGNTGILVEI
jgi:hypothetical protein